MAEHLLLADVADLRAVRITCTTCNRSKLLVDLGTSTPIKQQCNCDWGRVIAERSQNLVGYHRQRNP
jgi:hypothetical protein